MHWPLGSIFNKNMSIKSQEIQEITCKSTTSSLKKKAKKKGKLNSKETKLKINTF